MLMAMPLRPALSSLSTPRQFESAFNVIVGDVAVAFLSERLKLHR